MLLDHTLRRTKAKACDVCQELGFTTDAEHTCHYCEAEVCDAHYEDFMCSNCIEQSEQIAVIKLHI